MMEHRGEERGSILTGKSMYNQGIERLWRDVFESVLALYHEILWKTMQFLIFSMR